MNDFLPLDRKILNHWLWKDKPFSKGQAWIDLLMLANYKDRKKIVKDKVITYKRGDVNLSMVQLADRWGWDRRKVKRFLNALESDGIVLVSGAKLTKKWNENGPGMDNGWNKNDAYNSTTNGTEDSTSYGTTVTIVNYGVFDSSGTTDGTTDGTADSTTYGATDGTMDVQTTVRQVNTDNKYKEDEEVKKEKKTHTPKDAEMTKRIVDYLNDKCGTHYKANTESTVGYINARLESGYTEEDFYMVIDKKTGEWIGTKMEKFLRPKTLFTPENFESYLNQRIIDNGYKNRTAEMLHDGYDMIAEWVQEKEMREDGNDT